MDNLQVEIQGQIRRFVNSTCRGGADTAEAEPQELETEPAPKPTPSCVKSTVITALRGELDAMLQTVTSFILTSVRTQSYGTSA